MPLNPNVNRVTAMIRQQEDAIAQRLATGKTTQEQLDRLHLALNMEIGEYCRFQELKSLASVSGLLTLEEGQLIYQYLGNTVEAFNAQPLAIKVVLTKVFEELLTMRIRAKRRAG